MQYIQYIIGVGIWKKLNDGHIGLPPKNIANKYFTSVRFFLKRT